MRMVVAQGIAHRDSGGCWLALCLAFRRLLVVGGSSWHELKVKGWMPLSVKRYCLVLAVCGGSMSIASLIPMPFMSSLPQKRAG